MVLYTRMSRSARSEAFHLIHEDEIPEPPQIPNYKQGSPEALALLEGLKTPYFASLALNIDTLFAQVALRRQQLPPYGASTTTSDRPARSTNWQAVAKTFHEVFATASEDIKDTEQYVKAESYLHIFNELDRGQWLNMADQLYHGAGTGIGTVLTFQRNAPAIIRHHQPDSSVKDYTAIMRHPSSLILPRKQARLAINHMMAAQSALVGERERHDWGNIDRILNPEEFHVAADKADRKLLTYADFDGLTVPRGYLLNYMIPRTKRATLASEIPTFRRKVIGCPITLLQGRLAQLFDWGLEAVEQENLWEEEWPPKTATDKG